MPVAVTAFEIPPIRRSAYCSGRRGAQNYRPFWSPDGRSVGFISDLGGLSGGRDVMGIRPGVGSVAIPLVATDAQECAPSVSPDGKWLAYGSDASGRDEIFVSPFPGDRPGSGPPPARAAGALLHSGSDTRHWACVAARDGAFYFFEQSVPSSAPTVVIQNWLEELRVKVP